MTRPGSVVASVIAWALGAAFSIGVGLLALSLIGVGLTGGSGDHLTQPVGRAEPPPVATADPTTTPDSPSASATGSAPPVTATGPTRTIETAGGNVVARCEPGGAYLAGWSPSPGFRFDEVSRGPAPEARVTFEGNGREIKVRVTCIGLTVHPSIQEESSGGNG